MAIEDDEDDDDCCSTCSTDSYLIIDWIGLCVDYVVVFTDKKKKKMNCN
jgi:hypothetical protein